MKKALSLITALIIAVSCCFCFELTALADDDVTFTYDASTQTVTYSGTGSIKANAYVDFDKYGTGTYAQVKEIYIGDGITSIGECAFFGCTSLEKVVIYSSTCTVATDKIVIGDSMGVFSKSVYDSLTIYSPESATSVKSYAENENRGIDSKNIYTIYFYRKNGSETELLKTVQALEGETAAELAAQAPALKYDGYVSHRVSVPGGTAMCHNWSEREEIKDVTSSATYTETIRVEECTDYLTDKITKAPTCTSTGLKDVYCSKCGYVYQTDVEVDIDPTAHNYVLSSTKAATCTEDGYNVYTCTYDSSHSYTVPVSATGHSYTASVVDPSYTAGGYTLHTCSICGTQYYDAYTNPLVKAAAAPSGAKKVNGDYVNTKYKKASIKKLKKGKKQITVQWKKVSGVKGYQIQYSTSKKFTKKTTKSATISKQKTTSKTLKKLKSKKTYYVRIRTYKTVKFNGKTVKVYSSWSKVKSIKTK